MNWMSAILMKIIKIKPSIKGCSGNGCFINSVQCALITIANSHVWYTTTEAHEAVSIGEKARFVGVSKLRAKRLAKINKRQMINYLIGCKRDTAYTLYDAFGEKRAQNYQFSVVFFLTIHVYLISIQCEHVLRKRKKNVGRYNFHPFTSDPSRLYNTCRCHLKLMCVESAMPASSMKLVSVDILIPELSAVFKWSCLHFIAAFSFTEKRY